MQQRNQNKKDENYRIFHNNTAPTGTKTMRNSAGLPPTNRVATSSSTVTTIQLTPLWEHILRTRKLPDTICPRVMFSEFLERLKDPEWQVRQHALRVFVDVLVVMKSRADPYMEPLIGQLVENLGHQAPTVRKGALDCLRVYLAETAMPETIMLQILDIGLNQKITNEPFGGRLTCGVMLSLPALVQSTLHTPKSHFILRTTIDMLVQKMGQVTHQEITLKVLRKMRELIGEGEFMKYMSHGAYREFDLLCNVYGLSGQEESLIQPTNANFLSSESNTNTWRLMAAKKPSKLANCWRSSEEEDVRIEEQCTTETVLACPAKVIMETEIKINDDTLTMRILEAKDDDVCIVQPEMCHKSLAETCPNSLEDEVICGRLASAKSLRESSSSLVKLLSDSDDMEEEKPKQEYYTTIVTPSTPSRTPKRVTFGGEVVKMRTPDSDANSTTNNNHQQKQQQQTQNLQQLFTQTDKKDDMAMHVNDDNQPTFILQSPPTTVDSSKTSVLTLDIPNDNTKPLTRPKSGPTLKSSGSTSITPSPAASSQTTSPKSPAKSPKDSPKSPFKRLSISPVDNIISPRTAHKEIEVLHNLQRDPSPNRALTARRASLKTEELNTPSPVSTQPLWMETQEKKTHCQQQQSPVQPPPPRSWEELGIVDDDTLMDLRSGNWRHRLQGVLQLEQALRSSENLASVQPCLDSLLRTLLSSECKTEVAEEKRKLLINLITRLPLDNLEDRTMQIMSGLCRQGGAGANRVCKALMQRLPPAAIILKLISQEFLHAKSSRFREHALQMVIFALMTFPSTCFDTQTCVTNATYAAINRKRRVRQAALDVLAVLGQISSAREVLDIVQQIANSRDDGDALVAAVKTRLSRKQLPLVSSEGAVQYSLHVPPSQLTCNTHDKELKLQNESNNNNNSSSNTNEEFDKTTERNGQQGPDIDWITAGIGSVSPTSLKRRAHRNRISAMQSFTCLNTQGSSTSDDPVFKPQYRNPSDLLSHIKNYENEDNHHHNNYNFHHVFASSPYNYGLSTKKSNADYPYYTTRRLVANSCSDSSVDGRSSDSNYTSSGGSAVSNDVNSKGGGGCADGISGRFTRQAVNSRFPSMDMNTTYRVHKPPTYYPGMGAYPSAHLQQQQYNMNSTYPKVNYSLTSQQYHHPQLSHRRKSQNNYSTQHHQQQQQQSPPYYYINNNTNRAQHFNHHNTSSITTTAHKSNCGNQENFKMSENLQHKDFNNCDDNLDGTYTISPGGTKLPSQPQQQQQAATNGRRFVNVDKFLMQSNKSSQTSIDNGKEPQQTEIEAKSNDLEKQSNKTPTPSVKSTSYSQKSTASAQSSNGSRSLKEESPEKTNANDVVDVDDDQKPSNETNNIVTTPLTTVEGTVSEIAEMTEVTSESPTKWITGEEVLQLEDVVDAVSVNDIEENQDKDDEKLQRNGSLVSLQSKTESIKTQLEDTPPILSRTQSAKSVVIEEDIEDNTSFVVVEDVDEVENISNTQEVNNIIEDTKAQGDGPQCCSKPNSAKSRPSSSRPQSPTIEEIKALSRRNSMVKSMESLYERPPSKHDYIDNTTETSSQSSAQLNSSTGSSSIPLKALHTPLKQKSKTTHFLKSHRRISPVKQSIKMVQAELYPATLQRFEKPREAIMKTFDQLDSSNWEVVMVGLKNMVRLIRYHPENLDPQMHMICIQLTRSVRNLRSQVARAACTAATELFTIKSRYLEQECDDLVCALLHRTADTNRFIRADATRALESMCDNLTPAKILNILTNKGALHPNALVRTTTAKLLNRLVERLSSDKIYTMPRDQRDKFFVTGANLLLEGSLETRSYAKSLFKLLSSHASYPRILLEVIPPRTYRNIEKTLKSIR
ncbi:TOG array regulator of axonemal microtubules protein 1 [Lucilia cuprina]|nr:TOG array regulator of axonemal microtubules protein 1 [Lucilia cuprina]